MAFLLIELEKKRTIAGIVLPIVRKLVMAIGKSAESKIMGGLDPENICFGMYEEGCPVSTL